MSEARKSRMRSIEENQSRIMVVAGGDSLEKVMGDRAVMLLVLYLLILSIKYVSYFFIHFGFYSIPIGFQI